MSEKTNKEIKMSEVKELKEVNTVKVRHECDVLVSGGGVAGIAAALAAARSGARVLLIEKSFILGGLATSGLVTIYLPLCDGRGRQVSFGLAEELFKLSIKYGYEENYPTAWLDREASVEERSTGARYEVQFNAQLFALAAEELLIKEGVEILYGTLAAAVQKENGKISHVIVENKSGREAVRAGSVVDATGDADICALAGAACAHNKMGNVLAAWYYFVSGGEYSLNMLGFCDSKEDEANAVLLSPKRFFGTDALELSEMTKMSHASTLNDFLKRKKTAPDILPVTIATIPQIRMTRKIVGKYTLDESEVHTYQKDSVGMVSDWRTRGPVFEIPFGTLYGEDVKNLICAGRCISVTDEMWDITRVIPDCAVTGEAAGIAAAMSDDFSSLDVEKLQKELCRRGVKLHETELEA